MSKRTGVVTCLTVALAGLVGFAPATAAKPKQAAPIAEASTLEHYGFAVVDAGWHDPLDVEDPLRTNYVDEVAGFTDTNHMVIYDYQDDVVDRLDYMASKGMKAFLAVEAVFFNNGSPDADDPRAVKPFPDYQERWARFLEINGAALDADHIQAFYVVDEPYLRDLTYDEVKTATDVVAATFPDIPVAIVEAWSVLDRLQVPESVDWVGFDDFVGDPYNDAIFRQELEVVKAARTRPDQRIIIVMWSNWSIDCCTRNGEVYLPEDMGRVARSYHAIAREDPSVVAIIGYLWAGGIDGVQLGARDLPQSVKDEYARIGREIIGSSPGP